MVSFLQSWACVIWGMCSSKFKENVSLRSSNSNDSCFRQNHLAVLVGSDGSHRTSYPLPVNSMLWVTQVTNSIAYVPPELCARNVVTLTHRQNDMCVSLFAEAAVIVHPFTQHLVLFIPFSSRVPQFTSPLLLHIGCHTLPKYVYL